MTGVFSTPLDLIRLMTAKGSSSAFAGATAAMPTVMIMAASAANHVILSLPIVSALPVEKDPVGPPILKSRRVLGSAAEEPVRQRVAPLPQKGRKCGDMGVAL